MFFSTNLLEPESPVFLDDGNLLVVEMDSYRGCVTHISSDGKQKNMQLFSTFCVDNTNPPPSFLQLFWFFQQD